MTAAVAAGPRSARTRTSRARTSRTRAARAWTDPRTTARPVAAAPTRAAGPRIAPPAEASAAAPTKPPSERVAAPIPARAAPAVEVPTIVSAAKEKLSVLDWRDLRRAGEAVDHGRLRRGRAHHSQRRDDGCNLSEFFIQGPSPPQYDARPALFAAPRLCGMANDRAHKFVS
jgi:hypothetical protein